MPSYSWTQPICAPCYAHLHPDRMPVTISTATEEVCAWCGEKTSAGIYYRVDPATVEFPTPKDLS